MKGRIIIASVIVLVVVLACGVGGGLYYLENYDKNYYSQIDNTKLEKLSTNSDMKFQYTLDCYDKNGRKKELRFKTSRQLKEDAYLMLEVRSLGVHRWEEVSFDQLPQKVQEQLQNP